MIIIKKINDLTRFPIIFIIFTLKNKKKDAYVLLLIKKQNSPMNLRESQGQVHRPERVNQCTCRFEPVSL